MATPRPKQAKAIEFVEKAIRRGFKHIALNCPTGSGKTGIGASVCLWAGSEAASGLLGQAGGYYLTIQKLLQDQIESEFVSRPELKCASLKSAASYECQFKGFGTCEIGKTKRCICSRYEQAKAEFVASTIGVTNYAWFITERMQVGKMPGRRVLICDEAHNLESTLIRMFDIVVGKEHLDDVDVLEDPPELKTIDDFIAWCRDVYWPTLDEKFKTVIEMVNASGSEAYIEKATRLGLQLQRLTRAIVSMENDRNAWVFWGQKDDENRDEYIARPLFATDYVNILFDSADTVIYMSSSLGDKSEFCKSLGLNEDDVAWASFGSTFPPENRPIVMGCIGSMGRKSIDATTPRMVRMIDKILTKHKNEKGLIHVNSYKIGHSILDGLKSTVHAKRLIFPTNADEREKAFELHTNSDEATVMISPSMTEGFDFAEDLARWQVVVKVPWKSLGDKHTMARKNLNNGWYGLETVKSVIQMTGRIVRSETDIGVTYFLDSDIEFLMREHGQFFPAWWKDALISTQGKQLYPRQVTTKVTLE